MECFANRMGKLPEVEVLGYHHDGKYGMKDEGEVWKLNDIQCVLTLNILYFNFWLKSCKIIQQFFN